MTRLFSLLLICASAWAIPAAGKYHGDQVLRVKYETNLQEAELQSLLETDNGISMWNDHWTGEVDFHVPAISLGVVKEKLATYDVSVMVENVQYIVDEEKRNSNFNKDLRGTTPTPDQMFSDYFDYQVINNFMNGLPGASSFVLNQTYNGNPITAFQFGTGPKNIVFQGGIHARLLGLIQGMDLASCSYIRILVAG